MFVVPVESLGYSFLMKSLFEVDMKGSSFVGLISLVDVDVICLISSLEVEVDLKGSSLVDLFSLVEVDSICLISSLEVEVDLITLTCSMPDLLEVDSSLNACMRDSLNKFPRVKHLVNLPLCLVCRRHRANLR